MINRYPVQSIEFALLAPAVRMQMDTPTDGQTDGHAQRSRRTAGETALGVVDALIAETGRYQHWFRRLFARSM